MPRHEYTARETTKRERLALVYDDQTRPETTGTYCRRALEKLVEVTFFHPTQLSAVPREGFDLYLNIDDGMRYHWPAELRPCAWWAIDTHMDFAWCLEKARGFDFVFAAQRDGAALLRREGIASARWLPLACDAQIHGRIAESEERVGNGNDGEPPSPQASPGGRGRKEYDICFVGNLMPGARSDLVRLIEQHFKSVYVGQAYFEEMARIYSASRIIFNRSVKNDINMRVFEALASGSLLMTNDLAENGQAELFRDGVHLATYHEGHDLLDKLRYYLRRDKVRERIAAAGRQEVLAKHTYRHRLEEILRVARGRVGAPGHGVARTALTPALSYGEREKAGDLSYFDFARPEVLQLVPATARCVLEIGCGAGRLGEALKQRQTREVVGVELNAHAAEKAKQRLDRVIAGDVERLTLDFADGSFDCLVCADVLEHLVDPEGFLVRARRWLKDDATVVASIPNVRHHSVVGSLIEGNWTYEPAGLLDNTHLHFFTRRDAQDLFQKAGYEVQAMQFVPGPGYEDWRRQADKSRVQVGRVLVTGLPPAEAEEFFVYQFLIRARPMAMVRKEDESATNQANEGGSASPPVAAQPLGAAAACNGGCSPPMTAWQAESKSTRPHPGPLPKGEGAWPKCLLLMVTYNRLEYTRLALEAVLQLDYPNLRVVVWDNASTDGTVAYLRDRLKGLPHVMGIASPSNRGVVFPMNEVWSSDPEAELLAKIDNDTLVPPDLLMRLAECHLQSQRFGVLSGFHFRQEGEALAEEHRIKTFDGVRVLPQPYVGGCAVMIRRDVFQAIGPITCRTDGPDGRPFMDSGWTVYQQRLTDAGFVNGYPWPPIHVDHMEDTRSPHCIRSEEHQRYKTDERGMGLEEFTRELCVWRPNWSGEDGARTDDKRGPQPVALRTDSRSTRPHPGPLPRGEGEGARMQFHQDFMRDFDEFDFWGAPFAFARFADGERAICMGTPIKGQDGWSFDGRQADFAAQLNAALRYDAPGYYVGISDGCCDLAAKEWYLQQIRVPLARVTFSNIFVNANYRRFKPIDTSDMAIVASEGGDYWVPEDVMNSNFDLDQLVHRLLAVDRPILVSAGPASCIIIHRYWQRAVKKQVIVDVGSAIDERTKGRKTRQYQVPGTRTAELCCRW
jgi:2-polyprenyl-3-methyl-5-hydroxy-6-metoxy-1,4-benzoquinol methylase/GT2 family glycosyltransferase